MRGRKPNRFVLKRKDKVALQELLRDGQTPLRVARRAQILLHRAQGQQQRVKPLSDALTRMPPPSGACANAIARAAWKLLCDAHRSGRPRVFFRKRTAGD